MQPKLFAAVVLVASVTAQDRDFASCSSLSCINPESRGVCSQGNSPRAYGVGIVSEAFNVSDEKLSLTLVDGAPDGILASQEDYEFSTQRLFVGVSPNHNSSSGAAGCALMMQYQAQTFELADDDDDQPITTSCPATIPDDCQKDVAEQVGEFRFNGGGGQGNDTANSNSLPRCQSLAQFLKTNIHSRLSFCGRHAGFFNVSGGPIAGGDLSSSPVELQDEGCQPVLPESYELRQVADMRQILPKGEEGRLGGRSGVTPVFTVIYDDDDEEGSRPNVQFSCMRTFNVDGDEMPDRLNVNESGAVSTTPGVVVAAAVSLVSFALLLG
ncbi:hypothetical protein CPLU01_11526 [Colletotrichum plurivorum]|uniref:Uncharacterized protein n=1 Tax=Colletotrichum plurivorum TaxID=2175906 RepID=A0A8H6K1B3_9PEZI|nr:hypothetical protein CPLU01_11526 [Colletotrichum plurivorum]